ncbi:hypothetical protein Zmor_001884 [Zophobas morio]|uniref:Uncharacterized protein n=1 Tax=Zophobas morio TaxID=2755281 RepID=A0AA38MT23_9CUCU|nr:hypothetical protein Zmor_001884 [Zophobas morio]
MITGRFNKLNKCESTGSFISSCRTLANITALNIVSGGRGGPAGATRFSREHTTLPSRRRRRHELWPGSTSDTPFTDHSGEPLPVCPLHLPPHCKHVVNARQLTR